MAPISAAIASQYLLFNSGLMSQTSPTMRALEFELELQVGAVLTEIGQVQRPRIVHGMAGHLSHECRGQQNFLCEIDLQRRADIPSFALKGLKQEAVIGTVVFHSSADRDLRCHTEGERGR